jgi:hypothetical protein
MSASRRAVRHIVRDGGPTVNVSMPKIHAIARTFPRTVGLISIASVGVALAVGIASPAGAAIPTRITAGQAHAVFQSAFTGGVAIQQNPAAPGAAPLADEVKPVVMSPISSSPDDPYCVLDWHVIRVLLSSNVLSDLVGSDVRIWLDGTALAITSTAIKPLVHFPGIYTQAWGVVVPPGTPTVGPHTLTTTFVFGDGTSETHQTTINVGSATSPACTGS